MSSSPTHQQEVASSSKPSQSFEFTKRKRWADLIVTEMVNSIVFILSPTGQVLYTCGNAITEILGWRDSELIDKDLSWLVVRDDQANYQEFFHEVQEKNEEEITHLRLRVNDTYTQLDGSPSDFLFEMKMYPFSMIEVDDESRYFIAVVAPYPARNFRLLITTADLCLAHALGTSKVLANKKALPPDTLLPSFLTTASIPIYATSSLNVGPPRKPQATVPYHGNADDTVPSFSSLSSGPFDAGSWSSRDRDPFNYLNEAPGPYAATANSEDSTEEGSKKKKIKLKHPSEEYVCVTCGRTQSPEWRKGPLGPKTLCNACGLRWAKQNRKPEDLIDDSELSAPLVSSV